MGKVREDVLSLLAAGSLATDGKFVHVCTVRGTGVVGVQLYSFLTSVLDKSEWSASPAWSFFPLGKNPITH